MRAIDTMVNRRRRHDVEREGEIGKRIGEEEGLAYCCTKEEKRNEGE
jgi:hypothetical protein